MNIYKLIVLASVFALFACKDSSKENTVSTDSSITKSPPDTLQPVQQIDSATTPYWEQLPLRTIAHLILIDSIRPVTSPVIYKMLDSLTSDTKQSRQFYLKVFNKVMNKADGELAESIGGYALTYVQNYPKEFLESSRSFSANQLEAWAGNIGIELFLTSGENVKEAFDQLDILFNENCINCNSFHRSRLKQFNNMIWRTIQENRKEQQ